MRVEQPAGLQEVHELVDHAAHDAAAPALEDHEDLFTLVHDPALQEGELMLEFVGDR